MGRQRPYAASASLKAIAVAVAGALASNAPALTVNIDEVVVIPFVIKPLTHSKLAAHNLPPAQLPLRSRPFSLLVLDQQAFENSVHQHNAVGAGLQHGEHSTEWARHCRDAASIPDH
jgi:hypothetical protein